MPSSEGLAPDKPFKRRHELSKRFLVTRSFANGRLSWCCPLASRHRLRCRPARHSCLAFLFPLGQRRFNPTADPFWREFSAPGRNQNPTRNQIFQQRNFPAGEYSTRSNCPESGEGKTKLTRGRNQEQSDWQPGYSKDPKYQCLGEHKGWLPMAGVFGVFMFCDNGLHVCQNYAKIRKWQLLSCHLLTTILHCKCSAVVVQM